MIDFFCNNFRTPIWRNTSPPAANPSGMQGEGGWGFKRRRSADKNTLYLPCAEFMGMLLIDIDVLNLWVGC